MNRFEVLNRLFKLQAILQYPDEAMTAQVKADACQYVSEAIEELRKQPVIYTPENVDGALIMLAHALQPFAAIESPDHYGDMAGVAVEIPVTNAKAAEYAAHWDELKGQGETPPYARPDVETGRNIPTYLLNREGINMGDIRQAKKALALVTAIPVSEEIH